MKAIVKQYNNNTFQFYSERQLSRKTVENYSNAVKRYLSYIGNNHLTMGFDSVIKWLNTIENARTHNLNLQGIKAYLLKYFEDRPASELLELARGFKKIKRRKPKVSIDDSKFITLNEYEKLVSIDSVEKLKPYIRKRNELSGYTDANIRRTVLSIQSLFWTGCRISELLSIKIKNCHINGTVTIKIKNGKGGKERLVYLQKDIFNKIRKTFKGREYLFETRKGTQYNRLNVTKDIHRFAKKILRREISAHTMRHSKAMYLKDIQHLSPDQVAKALGHSSVVTTLQHYFHGAPTSQDQGIY
jgi:integrase/recombinase XerD